MMQRLALPRLLVLIAIVAALTVVIAAQASLDRAARQWVDTTLRKLSIEQLAGQMVFPRFAGTYLSNDSDEFEALSKLVTPVRSTPDRSRRTPTPNRCRSTLGSSARMAAQIAAISPVGRRRRLPTPIWGCMRPERR